MSAQPSIDFFATTSPHKQLEAPRGSLVQRLQRKYADRITGHVKLPAREASYAPFPDGLPESVRGALRARGIEQLYSHQREAWDLIERGGMW